MYCRHCGKELKENASFCSACGTPRGTTGGQTGVIPKLATQSQYRNKRRWMGLGTAIVVIGIIVGIIIITPLGNTVRRHLKSGVLSESEFRISKRTYIYKNGLTEVEEFSYDTKGRLTETRRLTEYKDDSGEVQTEDFRESITYINDSDTLYNKTVENAKDSDENGNYRKVIHDTLNDKDFFVTRTIEDYDGTAETINATYEYHPNGEMSRCINEYMYSDEEDSNTRCKRGEDTYDENGELTHRRIEYGDGDITDITYTRSSDETLIRMDYNHSSSSYNDSRVYYYDEYGNESSVTYEDGTVCQYELSLDAEGRVLRRVEPQTERVDGLITSKVVYEYRYDNDGNECYMKYDSYGIDSGVDEDWSYEVYTEYIRV